MYWPYSYTAVTKGTIKDLVDWLEFPFEVRFRDRPLKHKPEVRRDKNEPTLTCRCLYRDGWLLAKSYVKK